MAIELESTEIAILVKGVGLLMQVRLSDHNQLGLWGGVLDDGELPSVPSKVQRECHFYFMIALIKIYDII